MVENGACVDLGSEEKELLEQRRECHGSRHTNGIIIFRGPPHY